MNPDPHTMSENPSDSEHASAGVSVLDKHPAPWMVASDDDAIRDGKGETVGVYLEGVATDDDEDVQRLILAAPELLAALKRAIVADDANGANGAEPFIVDSDARELAALLDDSAVIVGMVHAPPEGCFLGIPIPRRGRQRVVDHCDCFPVEVELLDDDKLLEAWNQHLAAHPVTK